MRPRTALVTTVLFLATVLPLSPANAEPIAILGGSMIVHEHLFDPLPSIDIHGTRGFALHGVPEVVATVGPWQCRPCAGATLPISTSQGSADLPGVVDFEGNRYPQSQSGAEVVLFFTGAPLVLPPVSATAVLSGAFDLSGFLQLRDAAGEGVPRIPLFGHGTATIELVSSPSVPVWEFKHIQYDFAAPTPEPGTLFLVAGAMIAAACR